jgi:hypothetical protein
MTAAQPAAQGLAYMTVDEMKSAMGSKPRKYRNEPTTVDGIRFDSKKEARRYRMLMAAQDAGVISDLQRQVRYQLHCAPGLADFVYVRDDKVIVEDVKSAITRKNAVYRLKKRWMLLEHGVEISEW